MTWERLYSSDEFIEQHWNNLPISLDDVEDDIRHNVKRGIEFIEGRGVDEWEDEILDTYWSREFNIEDCNTCAVGVTVGNFSDLFRGHEGIKYAGDTRKSYSDAIEMGFALPAPDEIDDLQEGEWEALEDAWIVAAKERAISKGKNPEDWRYT